jgi:hypothetical protein
MFEKARRMHKDRKRIQNHEKDIGVRSNTLQNMNPVHDSNPMNL